MNLDELKIVIRYGSKWEMNIAPFNWQLKPSKYKNKEWTDYAWLCLYLTIYNE